ncbi:MAG TPA: HAD family hydrolase [Prosthecochloris aestuarii]|mgnify:CR=1 FL=1|uniref:phosphoglycolate phosphatase n=1 Tax=Prosthecochloris aestuarii TaxID=1102 RepID=A0A831WPU6_PROAE|nr:HAD family hydrolase [Prosthecochloris aestuarii]
MEKKLVLFDIDGTLLKVSGMNRRTLIDALVSVYGTEGSAGTHNFAGRMDSVIIYEVLQNAGLSRSQITKSFEKVKQIYIDLFRQRAKAEDIELMTGIPSLLDALAARKDILLGLLTGNFEGSGRHKLLLPSINHHFSFGAFADDAWHRNDLPSIAIKRAQQCSGNRFLPEQVVIIGDTEHDIRCAKTINANCIAVATGTYTASSLEKHGADTVFENFSQTAEVIDRILSF